jgi:hypothetical protein
VNQSLVTGRGREPAYGELDALRGATDMQRVLADQHDPRLRAYIVWVPKLGAREGNVAEATRTVEDQRASHYWDGAGYLTGDTNATSTANNGYGGWGGIYKLSLDRKGETGSLSIFINGDQAHTGFDNITFLSRDDLAVVEDAGDGLHTARSAFDSAYVVDTTADYASTRPRPGSSPKAGTRPRPWTRPSPPSAASITTVTTRSPAYTPSTATPAPVGCSVPPSRTCSRTDGDSSGPNSTATTPPGRSPHADQRMSFHPTVRRRRGRGGGGRSLAPRLPPPNVAGAAGLISSHGHAGRNNSGKSGRVEAAVDW